MFQKGDLWKSYHTCKTCKPYCHLADYYVENAFVRKRDYYRGIKRKYSRNKYDYAPFVQRREIEVPYRGFNGPRERGRALLKLQRRLVMSLKL